MNTKTNSQHASNSYNGETMGRDSPSALLDMLAEVASQTLHSEEKRINSLLASQSKTVNLKRKESCFTVSQLLSMPVSHLVKQFTIFTSDELKRQYSYTCALVPGCQQKYTSFASEGKARTSIRNHLEEHLNNFKADKEAYDTFTAKSVNHKNLKTNLQNKKRVQQTKKPQETLNKENKGVILEKSTNYLRKILSNDINIKEFEKQKCFQKSENKEAHNSELKNSDEIDFKVFGDHSYFERLDDNIPNRKGMSSFNEVLNNTAEEENIVLMVVGTDGIHMKEYSHVNQKLSGNTDSDTLYLSDLSWSDESQIRNTEVSVTTKPKGKAKFIGTSKEEREMALAYMDRIKKKGNPTGSNLQCRICNPPRTFTAPTTLVSHYRSHAGIKPYECRICRAVFTRRHSLKYHMLIHQNQTRFTCTDCGKKFRHPSHFKEHQRRHTGEAPFGCDDCGQRFKTRNTYKRHLKTRHGKILTTTGELLHLSEEDFQKVRTNRRKKDCALETTTNDDTVANAIVDFGGHGEPQQIVEEYILKDNADDINRNWETKGTMHVIDKCLEGFEICSASDLNKTDGIETEIAVDCRYPDSNIKVECIDDAGNDLLQLKNTFYNNIEVIDSEETRIVYQHNKDQNKTYECGNLIQSYSEIDCNSEILKEEEEKDVTMYKTNRDLSQERTGNNLHMLQESTGDYQKIIYNNDVQNKSTTYMHLEAGQSATSSNGDNQMDNNETYNNAHVFVAQNNATTEESDKYASFNDNDKEFTRNDITYCTQIINANVNILQTFDKNNREKIVAENENDILRKKEQRASEYKTVDADSVTNLNISSNPVETNQKMEQQQSKQYLYVSTESFNDMIAQNKCINIPVHEINLCRDQQNHLKAKVQDNCKKIKVLNGDIQAINIKQSDTQNTILFVSGDSLKNSILQIDKNNITVKDLKR